MTMKNISLAHRAQLGPAIIALSYRWPSLQPYTLRQEGLPPNPFSSPTSLNVNDFFLPEVLTLI